MSSYLLMIWVIFYWVPDTVLITAYKNNARPKMTLPSSTKDMHQLFPEVLLLTIQDHLLKQLDADTHYLWEPLKFWFTFTPVFIPINTPPPSKDWRWGTVRIDRLQISTSVPQSSASPLSSPDLENIPSERFLKARLISLIICPRSSWGFDKFKQMFLCLVSYFTGIALNF